MIKPNQLSQVSSTPAGDEITDEKLMLRIQGGDEEALAALFHRHHALLRTVVGRMISNDQDADDLLQECLLEIWWRAGTYRVDKGYALGWIVTLVRRRTIDRVRRKMAYARAQDRFRTEVETQGDESHHGADEEASRNDLAKAVMRLIRRLPQPQQQAVILAFYQGMSQRQIAAHTGIPLGTIKTRLELALRKLRFSAAAFGEFQDGPLAAAA
jgi:RNA polymerase sigma-70 factor (ECF subfamily)